MLISICKQGYINRILEEIRHTRSHELEVTGICLSLGAVLLSVWIILIALGPSFYSKFQILSSLIFFKIFLFLWTLTIFYHLYNGIRYLFWSFGKMMELSTVYKSGYIVIILSLLSTVLVWISI